MAKDKHPGGRPSKYSKTLHPKIEKLVKLGATDKEIAELIDVTESTFNLWKLEYPKFSEFLKGCKVITDSDMESSLRKRAMGCTTKETKLVRRLGRDTQVMEDFEEVTTIKEHPPETKAIEKWLDNRNPDRWKSKVENIIKTIDDDGKETGISSKGMTQDECKDMFFKLKNEN